MRRGGSARDLEARVRRAVPGEAAWLFVAGSPAAGRMRAVAASSLGGAHYVTYLEMHDPDGAPEDLPEAAFGVPPSEPGVVVRYQKAYRDDPFAAGMEFQRILGPLVEAEKEAAGETVPFGFGAVEKVVRDGQKRALMERLYELGPDGDLLGADEGAYRDGILLRLRQLVDTEEEFGFLESFGRFRAALPEDGLGEEGRG